MKGKKILITGGTGSLGQALTARLLDMKVDTIRIFSRNEEKQIKMENKFNDKRLRFLLGDINDVERLQRALENIDIVFHTAALKHVPKIEYNPFEAIKTNVIGSQNVINACLHENVEKAIAIGTDKAVSPLNTYGATKLLMEKLFVTANNFVDPKKYRTKFISVRYGNVFGSSGSVIPLFLEQIKKMRKITITDPKMTRFSITMEQALDFILNAAQSGKGSEIFVPDIKSYSILTVRDALSKIFTSVDQEIVGIRPGEKLHEELINKEEIRYTWKYNNMYMITNPLYPLFNVDSIEKSYAGIKKVQNLEGHSSDIAEKISKEEMVNMINNSGIK
jgi:UDP-N-acetylglucosamine 4,6-dehydratase|tara:strand:+ start:563 stop:1564 length:1002 start_codon:yes stop_codon:yes gene_type:complete